jgi:hypothetical protein
LRRLQFVGSGGDQPGAAHAERVADGDRAAVGIHARLVVGQAEVAQHGQPCAAKASLSSMTSICSSVRPVLASTLRTAGAGPKPMMRGARRRSPCRRRGPRGQAVLAGSRFGGQQQRAGAVIDAGGVAGGDAEFGAIDALQLGQHLQRGFRARMLVGVEDDRVALLAAG